MDTFKSATIEEINEMKREKSRIIKIKWAFIAPGGALILLPFIPILISIMHVDAHSAWFPPLFVSMLSLMFVGVVLAIIGSAYKRHRLYNIREILCKYPEIE